MPGKCPTTELLWFVSQECCPFMEKFISFTFSAMFRVNSDAFFLWTQHTGNKMDKTFPWENLRYASPALILPQELPLS